METIARYDVYGLSWGAAEQERSFRRVLLGSVATFSILAVLASAMPVPPRDTAQVQEVPRRLARFVLEREPPPAIIREELEPVPEPEAEPEPTPVVEQPPADPEPIPEPEPADATQQARDRANAAGLLPLAEQLAALRANEALAALGQTDLVSGAEGAALAVERALITSQAGAASGGVNTAAVSRNTGRAGLAARATSQVASPVELGDAREDQRSRSREEIEEVFDRNKGAIYALYNRALRENPRLQGKVVLRLTIAADGSVTSCEIVSSELRHPDLEQKLAQRVLLFKFEPKGDVEPITIVKPLEFLPA